MCVPCHTYLVNRRRRRRGNARLPPKPPPPSLANGRACGLPDKVFRRLHELTSVEKQLCSPVHIKPRYQLLSKGMFTLQGHTLMYVTWRRRVVAGRPTVVAAVLAAAVTRPRAHRVCCSLPPRARRTGTCRPS